ncbi:hypothetical protein BC629DRAFT_1439526 [Irpex lacteus]|nr:hypothetical protein BC629DRAFT_1439526 [Irpex lacteus]
MSRPPLRSFFVFVDLKRRNEPKGHVIEDRGNDVVSCSPYLSSSFPYVHEVFDENRGTRIGIPDVTCFIQQAQHRAKSLHTYGGGRSVDTAAQQAETARPINTNDIVWRQEELIPTITTRLPPETISYCQNHHDALHKAVHTHRDASHPATAAADASLKCELSHLVSELPRKSDRRGVVRRDQIYLRLEVDRYPPTWARTPMFNTEDQHSILMFAPMSGGGGGRDYKKSPCASVLHWYQHHSYLVAARHKMNATPPYTNLSHRDERLPNETSGTTMDSHKEAPCTLPTASDMCSDVSFRSTADVNVTWNTAVRGTGTFDFALAIVVSVYAEIVGEEKRTSTENLGVDGEEDKRKLENMYELQGWKEERSYREPVMSTAYPPSIVLCDATRRGWRSAAAVGQRRRAMNVEFNPVEPEAMPTYTSHSLCSGCEGTRTPPSRRLWRLAIRDHHGRRAIHSKQSLPKPTCLCALGEDEIVSGERPARQCETRLYESPFDPFCVPVHVSEPGYAYVIESRMRVPQKTIQASSIDATKKKHDKRARARLQASECSDFKLPTVEPLNLLPSVWTSLSASPCLFRLRRSIIPSRRSSPQFASPSSISSSQKAAILDGLIPQSKSQKPSGPPLRKVIDSIITDRFTMRRGEMRGRGEGDRNLRRANTEPTCSPPVLKLRMRKHVGTKTGGEEQATPTTKTVYRFQQLKLASKASELQRTSCTTWPLLSPSWHVIEDEETFKLLVFAWWAWKNFKFIEIHHSAFVRTLSFATDQYGDVSAIVSPFEAVVAPAEHPALQSANRCPTSPSVFHIYPRYSQLVETCTRYVHTARATATLDKRRSNGVGGDDRGFKLLKSHQVLIHDEVHTHDSGTNSSVLIFIYRAQRQRDRRAKRLIGSWPRARPFFLHVFTSSPSGDNGTSQVLEACGPFFMDMSATQQCGYIDVIDTGTITAKFERERLPKKGINNSTTSAFAPDSGHHDQWTRIPIVAGRYGISGACEVLSKGHD